MTSASGNERLIPSFDAVGRVLIHRQLELSMTMKEMEQQELVANSTPMKQQDHTYVAEQNEEPLPASLSNSVTISEKLVQ